MVETSEASARWHYLDSLRAVLMLIGIPFHSARFFRYVEGIDTVATFTSVWRMTTFFVVAGFFAVLVIGRRGVGPWWRGRLKRLGVPLLFAVLVLNPFQTWMLLGGDLAVERLTQWAWPWLHHAWFLLYLLIYCALLAAVVSLTGGRVDRALDALARVVFASPWTLALAALVGGGICFVLVDWWLEARLVQLSYGAFRVLLPVHAVSFVAGLLLGAGALSGGSGRITRVGRLATWPVLCVALVGSAWVLLDPVEQGLLEVGPRTAKALIAGVGGSAGLAWAALLLRWSERWWARDTVVVRWLVSASLPVYLMHLVVVYSVGPLVVDSFLPPVAGFVVLTLVVLVVSFGLYELTNRWVVTRVLLNGTRKPGVGVLDVLRRPPASPPAPPSSHASGDQAVPAPSGGPWRPPGRPRPGGVSAP